MLARLSKLGCRLVAKPIVLCSRSREPRQHRSRQNAHRSKRRNGIHANPISCSLGNFCAKEAAFRGRRKRPPVLPACSRMFEFFIRLEVSGSHSPASHFSQPKQPFWGGEFTGAKPRHASNGVAPFEMMYETAASSASSGTKPRNEY
ncbi:polysulfide reductase NrfD [Anopheles sinensis]|uniref:Polysulfide reductase NrfD n=1 Tax=Anopheles sinensis TaxID=74873 RepID=A0A084VGW4_ANOSI|nr:polysulfide reductase NrfD [Anopheles sinensis]